jgi:GAF domain-containing protein
MGSEDSKARDTAPAADKKSDPLLERREEFQQIFKKGAEFTEDLLKENERLRFRCAELEARHSSEGGDEGLVRELVDKVARLESERTDLVKRFAEVEAENKDFASRYVQVENENSTLLNIYVASYQLHSTLDFQEVLNIVSEIILNFIGAEIFALTIYEEEQEQVKILVTEGIEPEALGSISSRQGIVADVLKSGELYVGNDIDQDKVDPNSPVVCVPLAIKDNVIGTVSIYKFLQQKKALANVDHELFTLLAGHTATAMFAARLYTDSRRKLDTIQGLINLVTS